MIGQYNRDLTRNRQASGLGLTAWALSLHPGRRAFHFLGIAILFTASVAYFSLASDLGGTPIAVEFVRIRSDLYTGPDPNPTRSIWYVRCEPILSRSASDLG